LPRKLVKALSKQAGYRVSAVHQPREQRRVWLEMAQTDASVQSGAAVGGGRPPSGAHPGLAEALDLTLEDLDALRIEVFDIAHRRRGHARLPVVYDAARQSAECRATGSTTSRRGDDYAAMRQVLLRRYAKVAEALVRRDAAAHLPTGSGRLAAPGVGRWRPRSGRHGARRVSRAWALTWA